MTIQQVLQQAARDLKSRGVKFCCVRLDPSFELSSSGTMRQWAYMTVERPETGDCQTPGTRSTYVSSGGNADECYDGFQVWLDGEYPVPQRELVEA